MASQREAGAGAWGRTGPESVATRVVSSDEQRRRGAASAAASLRREWLLHPKDPGRGDDAEPGRPHRAWDMLYCAEPGCGYALTSWPPEAERVRCHACGRLHSTVDDIRMPGSENEEFVAGKQPPKQSTSISAGAARPFVVRTARIDVRDPETRKGVEKLMRIAGLLKEDATQAAAEGGGAKGATIDMFCEKCQRITVCSYYARQIRGADEGQTTFYTCTNKGCGHKFQSEG